MWVGWGADARHRPAVAVGVAVSGSIVEAERLFLCSTLNYDDQNNMTAMTLPNARLTHEIRSFRHALSEEMGRVFGYSITADSWTFVKSYGRSHIFVTHKERFVMDRTPTVSNVSAVTLGHERWCILRKDLRDAVHEAVLPWLAHILAGQVIDSYV